MNKIILSICLLSGFSLQAAQSVKMAESSSSSSSAAAPAYEFTLARRRVVNREMITIKFILTHNLTGSEVEKNRNFFIESITRKSWMGDTTVVLSGNHTTGGSRSCNSEEEKQLLVTIFGKAVLKFLGRESRFFLIHHNDITLPNTKWSFNIRPGTDGEPTTPLIEEEKEEKKKWGLPCTIL